MQTKKLELVFAVGHSMLPKLIILFAFLSYAQMQSSVGDWCFTEDGDDGICRPLRHCKSVYSNPEVFNGRDREIPGLCSYEFQGAIVCCPIEEDEVNVSGLSKKTYDDQESSTPSVFEFPEIVIPESVYRNAQPQLRISEKKCFEYQSSIDIELNVRISSEYHGKDATTRCPLVPNKLIIGGTEADLGDYPHMAALGYLKGYDVRWLCGGSLISDYFILTAGHCTSSKYGKIIVARLGELKVENTDFFRTRAKMEKRLGNAGDYPVQNVIKHPDYRTSSIYNDIALVRLKMPVTQFDFYVRPACLYSDSEVNFEKAIATGWGKTDPGSEDEQEKELRYVSLNLHENDFCDTLYTAESTRSSFSSGVVQSMICAGNLAGGKDTCQGDSGGPLQIRDSDDQCLYRILGVTSTGKSCGFANSLGIYTRVSFYLSWIESVVWN